MGTTDILVLLKTKFEELVVSHLSKEVQDAIRMQKEIENKQEFRTVKAAIEKRVLTIVDTVSDKNSIPSLSFFRDVANILADHYGYMYKKDPMIEIAPGLFSRKFTARGTGGPSGLKTLPKILQQAFRRMRDKTNDNHDARENGFDDEETHKKLPKRKAQVYGVDQKKFYSTAKRSRQEVMRELDLCVGDYEAREELFTANREFIQQILTGSLHIFEAVKGFFDDGRHLKLQFEWLTNRNILDNINSHASSQFNYLEQVLKRWIPTQDFENRLESARLKSNMINGSLVPIRVCLLRELNQHWHKTQSGFLRYPDEEEVESPHLVCSDDGDEGFLFSLHAEKKEVFSRLSFHDALAAFFHLTFVGNMRYPAKGEAVAVWLQRKVAGIVDEGEVKMNKL